MPSEYAVEVRNLSKRYDIFSSPGKRVRALLLGRRRDQRYFEALKPVSFHLEKGRFLGIIGQNGSGKSTLLQLISGILAPTAGSIGVRGKLAALLELGAGFNPEFTGRENARLNAEILGISGRAFAELLPRIEAFAEIGDFIDRPVRTYSSGMFVRLAFSVQACVEPDILIVDEALAVGDIFFRQKCYARLEELRRKGCTVILVTHSMDDVAHYCDQVMLLHHGAVVHFGEPSEAINRYYALGRVDARQRIVEDASHASALADGGRAGGVTDGELEGWPQDALEDVSGLAQVEDGLVRCTRLGLTDAQCAPRRVFSQFDLLKVWVEFRVAADLETPVVGFVIRTERGVVVHGRNSGQCGSSVPRRVRAGELVRAMIEIPLAFGAGEYLMEVGFATWPVAVFERAEHLPMTEMEAAAHRHCVLSPALRFSVVPRGRLGFEAQPFYGLASVASQVRLQVAADAQGGAETTNTAAA